MSPCVLEIPAQLTSIPAALTFAVTVGIQDGQEGLVQGTISSAQSPPKTLAALQQCLKTSQDLCHSLQLVHPTAQVGLGTPHISSS